MGTDSIGVIANDGILNSLEATIVISITAVNDPPIAQPQSLALTEDGALNITLSGSDIKGSTISFQLETNVAHGSLTGTPPNLVSSS